jgi:hypothetical protein
VDVDAVTPGGDVEGGAAAGGQRAGDALSNAQIGLVLAATVELAPEGVLPDAVVVFLPVLQLFLHRQGGGAGQGQLDLDDLGRREGER